MNNIIFVAGIHGVGKTTLCKQLSIKYGIEHLSASKIIAEAKKRPFTSLFIEEIGENQVILVNAVNNFLDKSKKYILDGHFCLLNECRAVEKVPQRTFELLGIEKIIVLIEDVNIIHQRLGNRLGINYDIELLNHLQKMEMEYSQQVSSILNVPYMALDISKTNEELLNSQMDIIFKENI